MKKTVFGILIICLLIGIPLIILDAFPNAKGQFTIPSDYSKIVIDLNEKTRDNEVVFSSILETPRGIDLYIQSDSSEEKIIEIASEHKIIGKPDNKYHFSVNQVTNNMANTLNQIYNAGQFTISLTNRQAEGKLVIGYRERTISSSEIERLLKIDSGDLDNPPAGYEKVYSTDLSGMDCKDEVLYTFTLDKTQTFGLSVYSHVEEGSLSVDFIGENTSYYGLVYSKNSLCDQMEIPLEKGEYQVRLNCENVDGKLIVFAKK